jgi:pimeloyl-ACP methyl ester carboxylesterase
VPRRLSRRFTLCSALAALAIAQGGCATKFVAKPANPLRPANTAGWEPGELSLGTRTRIPALHLTRDWKDAPAAAIAALEPAASLDPAARRAVIEIALAAGIHAHAKFLTDRGAAGLYLCAAEHASDGEGHGDAEFQKMCREARRYAVARLAGLREVALKNGIPIAKEIQGPTHSYRIILRTDVPGAVSLRQFKAVVATDRFKIVGLPHPAIVEGAGTPLVGKVRGGSRGHGEFTMQDDLWLPLTATVEFGPRHQHRDAIFTVYDRKNVETVQVGSRREPLAGDFSTAFAVRSAELNKENIVTLGILGFLRGDRVFDHTGLYPMEIPRTDKIPLVFVHGLISDPNDWRFLHSALLADPEIRRRYQFWAFAYPTSMPVPWSSTILRRELKRVQAQLNPGDHNPQLNHMVLVGHSMGGLLSRLQISRSGEDIYRQYFTRPVDRLRLSSADRSMVRDMFYFAPNPHVDEVIFICTPHQGSGLAANWVGQIARALAHLPLTIIKASTNILTINADALTADASVKPGTSIDSLSPGGKFVRTLKQMPMSPRVLKYGIIGNRGKPGPIAESSDGVVPYWSSHLDGVPETIIPSNHSGPDFPECAVKVAELLHQHDAVKWQRVASRLQHKADPDHGVASTSPPRRSRP